MVTKIGLLHTIHSALCLLSISAAASAITASAAIVAYRPLTVLVPHAVAEILLKQKTAHFSPAHLLHCQHVVVVFANVTVKRCSGLNPATLLPTAEDGEPHNCVHMIDQVLSPRPDLASDPLPKC